MGLTLAALRAGIKPATVPAIIITMVACMHTSSPTVGLRNMVAWNMPVSTTSLPMVAFMY